MNYLMDFLSTDEVKIVLVIGVLICVLGMVYYTIEKYVDSRKKKKNTKELNDLVESLDLSNTKEEKPVLEKILEPVTVSAVEVKQEPPKVEKEIPKIEPAKVEEKTEVTIEKTTKEVPKNSVEDIYTAVKEKVINNKEEQIKQVQTPEPIEKIEYTNIRPNKEEAKEEIRKATEELLKAQRLEVEIESLEVKQEKTELDKFEEEQEESAIISMEEFIKKGNSLYARNEEIQYKDEGNEPISLQDLEKKFATVKQEIKEIEKPEIKIEAKQVEAKSNKVVLNDFNTVSTKTYSEDHIFKSSPIISPIFGIEQEPTRENLELENTANYDKLDNEIRKTNEFLGKLRELKEKLN